MARRKVGEATRIRQILLEISERFWILNGRTGCVGLSIRIEGENAKITQDFPSGSSAVALSIANPDCARDDACGGDDIDQLPFALTSPGSIDAGADDRSGPTCQTKPPKGDRSGSIVGEATERLSGVPRIWNDSKKTLLLELAGRQEAEIRCADLPQLGSLLGAIQDLRVRRIADSASRKLAYVAEEADLTKSIASSRIKTL